MNIRIVLICIITIILVYFVGTKTLITSIHSQNDQKTVLNRDIQATTKAIENLNLIKTQIDQNAQDVKLMNIALPADESIPELLVMLESLYQTQGYSVSSISLGTTGANLAEVPTSISGNSTFEQLFIIFNAIQNNIRPAIVKSFTASGVEDAQTGAIQISSSFSLSFPFTSSSSETSIIPTSQGVVK